MEKNSKPAFLKIARSFGIFPSKKYGQHFLINEGALKQIVKISSISSDDVVLEIGPGIGNLTWHLAQEAGFVIAVEKDLRLKKVLNEVLKNLSNVYVLYEDALRIDLEKEVYLRKLPLPKKVVSNLPYNIASTLIIDYLSKYDFLETYVLMVQKEVAERIVARAGTAAYGALTLKVAAFADVRILMNLSPGSFFPPPEVESSVISLKRRKKLDDHHLFFEIVDASFRHRRKKIINSIADSGLFGFDKEKISYLLKKAGISSEERAENIEFENFLKLYKLIRKETSKNESKMADC